ncbi:MAG: hypothetical protein BWK77_08250 [Verrucomicrobia bacterium A1]|nr:MAG: hypothetical protein BWK77_08250 [Verrucomicrobia bacterium A1]
MYASNSVQTLLNDVGEVISSGVSPAAAPLDRVFGALVSINLVLWLFLPVVLLLVIWQVSSVAARLGQVNSALYRMTVVISDAVKEQTSAIHHLRDKSQAVLQAIQTSLDQHRDGVQQGARDMVKGVEAFDRHTQGGAKDIQQQLANIHDRLGKLIPLPRLRLEIGRRLLQDSGRC